MSALSSHYVVVNVFCFCLDFFPVLVDHPPKQLSLLLCQITLFAATDAASPHQFLLLLNALLQMSHALFCNHALHSTPDLLLVLTSQELLHNLLWKRLCK